MKLIVDQVGKTCQTVCLDEDRKPVSPTSLGHSDVSVHIEGVFAQADVKNRNGRIYPLPVLQKAIMEYTRDYVDRARALGELNHPAEPSVDPERACILVERLSFSGSDVIGRAKVLSTPVGDVLKKLLADGVQLGVSTRGLGSMKDDSIVDSDYTICAIDVVHAPSGIDCFVHGILESADFYIEHGVIRRTDVKKIEESRRKSGIRQFKSDVQVFEKRLFSRLNRG